MAGSSGLPYARAAHKAGWLTRKTMLRWAVDHLRFRLRGANEEATARVLFVHPNTVRYRLGRIATETGYDLTHAREANIVRIALAVGRLAQPNARGWRRSASRDSEFDVLSGTPSDL